MVRVHGPRLGLKGQVLGSSLHLESLVKLSTVKSEFVWHIV